MSDSTAANDATSHPKPKASPTTAHQSPAHVVAHAQPAAGFPVGTVVLVAAALIVGLAVGLLLHRRPGGRAAGAHSGGLAPVHPEPQPDRPLRVSVTPRPGPGYAHQVAEEPLRRGPALGGEPIIVSAPDGQAERKALVDGCIRARDMSNGAVRRILGEALAQAGVVEVDPTGQPFDPDLHRSVGLMHTPSARLDATVASSERVGYRDHGRQLRQPEVVVFTSEEAP